MRNIFVLPITVFTLAFIGLPSIPGVPPPENVLKGAALKEATKALGTTLAEEAPIRSSANVVYATVASLPGTPFNPGARGSVQVHPDGSIALSPGDYQLGVQVFCMAATSHSPSGNTFQL